MRKPKRFTGPEDVRENLNLMVDAVSAFLSMAVEGGEFQVKEGGAVLSIPTNDLIKLVKLTEDLDSPTDEETNPGKADARLVTSNSDDVRTTEEIIEVTNRITGAGFAEDDFILAIKNLKTNEWWPVSGGGGGAVIIARPTGEPCPGIGSECDCVEAEVIFNPCGKSPATGTIIEMWARAGKILNYPPEILSQTEFFATQLGNTDGLISSPDEYEYGAGGCVWIAMMPVGLCVESGYYDA